MNMKNETRVQVLLRALSNGIKGSIRGLHKATGIPYATTYFTLRRMHEEGKVGKAAKVYTIQDGVTVEPEPEPSKEAEEATRVVGITFVCDDVAQALTELGASVEKTSAKWTITFPKNTRFLRECEVNGAARDEYVLPGDKVLAIAERPNHGDITTALFV